MNNIKMQVRSVGELLTAVHPTIGETFVKAEEAILAACLKQVALDGNSTSRGGSFGTFAVSKVVAKLTSREGVSLFTVEEKSIIAAAWALVHAGSKIAGFKF